MSTVVHGTPVPEADQECSRCRRRTVAATRWHPATPEQRAAWRAARIAKRGGRGMCAACHRRAWVRGELIDHDTKVRSWADVRDEWELHADPTLSRRANAQALAPRLGMTPQALERAVERHREDVAA